MLEEKSRKLDSEMQKQFADAAGNNDAAKIARLLFQCLQPTRHAPPTASPDSIPDSLFLDLLDPDLLEFEKDDFDSVDIVSFYCSKRSILEEKDPSAAMILKEIVVAAAKKGFPDASLNIANRMKAGWEQGKAYEAVIYGYLHAGKLDKAFEHRVLIANKPSRLQLLYHIAAAQFSNGNKEACLKAINEALDMAKSMDGFDSNKSLGRIAVLQAKLDDFNSAEATIQAIDEADIRAIAWCHIALALAEAGNSQKSKEAFANALRESVEIRYTPNRFKCLLLIMEKQAEAGDFDGAISTAGTIEWDANRAAVLDRILGDGLPEDFWGCRVCAMHGYGEEFEQITARDKGLSRVAGVQARFGDVAGAVNTAKLIGWGPLQAEALFLIGKSLAASGNLVLATEKFASALVTFVESHSRSPSAFLWKLALEQAKIGDFDGALTTARLDDLAGIRAKVFAGIGELLGGARGWEASLEVWDEAFEATKMVNDVGLRIDILLEIAQGQVNAGGRDAARKTFLAARKLAEAESDLKCKSYVLLKIAAAQAKAMEKEQASHTFRAARDLAEKTGNVEEMRKVAVKLAESGFKDEVVEVSRAITESPGEWLWVAAVFVEQGDLESFKSMLFSGSYDAGTASKICVLLTQAYPDQAEAIADVVFGFTENDKSD